MDFLKWLVTSALFTVGSIFGIQPEAPLRPVIASSTPEMAAIEQRIREDISGSRSQTVIMPKEESAPAQKAVVPTKKADVTVAPTAPIKPQSAQQPLQAVQNTSSTPPPAPVVAPPTPTASTQYVSCAITGDLVVGSSGSQVRQLQQFLYEQLRLEGLSHISSLTHANVVTGNFTTATRSLLKQYQAEHNLSASGTTDAATRSAINLILCGGTPPSPAPAPTAASIPVDPACVAQRVSGATGPYQPCAPVIESITPGGGPLGTKITIRGKNFRQDSVLHFGNGADPGSISNDGTSMTTTIPNVPAWSSGKGFTTGIYGVAVSNPYGTSNSKDFTITVSLIIGVVPPRSNSLIQEPHKKGYSYTWKVTAVSIGIQSAPLEYRVNWGDGTEETSIIHSPAKVLNNSVNDSADISHVYQAAGNYSPTFTVRVASEGVDHSASKTVPITIQE